MVVVYPGDCVHYLEDELRPSGIVTAVYRTAKERVCNIRFRSSLSYENTIVYGEGRDENTIYNYLCSICGAYSV